ncbi:MAG: hypothetical protein N2255_07630 [Kiritimatiellae bacterium]|nr:hypothetical protein [Kiritimatiellia bacterium]
MTKKPFFARYVGIDYSGAATADTVLDGLRVYMAHGREDPQEMFPGTGNSRRWSRRTLAEWLVELLLESPSVLVGIDHAFSFPEAYFSRYGIVHNWDAFLDDFCSHWPTNEPGISVEIVRRGICGSGASRKGQTRWRRMTDLAAGAAKSAFHFDVPGSVAKSTHAGLPWLRLVRQKLGGRVHFWPFDGWAVRRDSHVVAEIYPSLWRSLYPQENRSVHQHDAYVGCRWLQEADLTGELERYLMPEMSLDRKARARFEGWILGVSAA